MKFIGCNDGVRKTFFDKFMKEWREINADHCYILSFTFGVFEKFVVDGHSTSIINDITTASAAQIIDDDLIFCAHISAKFVHGNHTIQSGGFFLFCFAGKMSHDCF